MRGKGEGRYRAALILACMLVCHRRIRAGIKEVDLAAFAMLRETVCLACTGRWT